MSWKASPRLMETIKHYASFPATGVSLRQMVQFGKDPSIGVYSPRLPTWQLNWAVRRQSGHPVDSGSNHRGLYTLPLSQAPSSELHSSSPKSSPYGWRTECRS